MWSNLFLLQLIVLPLVLEDARGVISFLVLTVVLLNFFILQRSSVY
jgi:hypothetical protein